MIINKKISEIGDDIIMLIAIEILMNRMIKVGNIVGINRFDKSLDEVRILS